MSSCAQSLRCLQVLEDSFSRASCQDGSDARAALNSLIGADELMVSSAAAFKMVGKGIWKGEDGFGGGLEGVGFCNCSVCEGSSYI